MNNYSENNGLTRKTKAVKKVSRVNKVAIKIALVVSTCFTINASAANDSSVESAISEVIVLQSNQLIADLKSQLELAIDNEIKAIKLTLLHGSVISSAPERQQSSKKIMANVSHENNNQLPVSIINDQ